MTELHRHHDALAFLRQEFINYGSVVFFGSSKHGRAFSKGHDFDAGCFTDIASKEVLVSKLESVVRKWDLKFPVKLHVFFVGWFGMEVREKDRYTVHFVSPYGRFFVWAKIKISRFGRSAFRRLWITVIDVMQRVRLSLSVRAS